MGPPRLEPVNRLPAAQAPSVMREMNQRLLLDRLFIDGPATRPELARDAGLSLPTVIAALGDLEVAGLVRQNGMSDVSHGRPAATYEANPGAGAVIAVDIGHEWLHLVAADLAGGRIGQVDVHNTAATARGLVELTGTAVESVRSEAGLGAGDIVHTVIGSPGVYDPKRRRINYAANLPGWQRLGIAEALTAQLGTDITIDNDANLAALGEQTYGVVQHVENFVYLTVGTGVGIGLFLNGALYRGAHGAAGEAGYLPLGETLVPATPGSPARGMLEEAIGAEAVVRLARDAGMAEPLTAETIFHAARYGDQRAALVVQREAKHIAQLIATVLALFDPEVIVLGGGIGQNLDLLEPDIKTALRLITSMSAPLRLGALGREAVVMGAVAAGLSIARRTVFQRKIDPEVAVVHTGR
jgi:predicted NBD/HSP70 family sugar kinase